MRGQKGETDPANDQTRRPQGCDGRFSLAPIQEHGPCDGVSRGANRQLDAPKAEQVGDEGLGFGAKNRLSVGIPVKNSDDRSEAKNEPVAWRTFDSQQDSEKQTDAEMMNSNPGIAKPMR